MRAWSSIPSGSSSMIGVARCICYAETTHTLGSLEKSTFPESIREKSKIWYLHRLKTLNYAVPVGRVRVVIYDDREGSPSRGQIDEHVLGEEPESYGLLTIPPLLGYRIQGLAPGMSLIANCSDLPNDLAESDRKPLDSPDVPYRWLAESM